ncbi:TetR/AcrR family transcriptional regulator [Azorhizobium doebereinerae]|uniref:TetR/AcrR family transcriptional regulator n=1 Tax=Azorhizobium doebereinerae TaxID=281091 RepID=UPI0004069B42|nr:TetR/AcrR family transcriptional regulator [Azorhizobium doebereinerae]
MAERRRRSQHERTAETSARLLNATIDLLHDQGFSRISTPQIAAQAGVSRGALTHHFATKEELVTDAINAMLERVTADLHRFAEDIAARGGSSDEIVDYIWRMMSDRLFYVTMEYLPEARHNDEFKDRLVPVVKNFHAGLDAIWMALAASRGADPGHTRTVMNASMCLVRGMIAQTVLREDPDYYSEMLAFWKAQVARHFPEKPARAARVAPKPATAPAAKRAAEPNSKPAKSLPARTAPKRGARA